MDFLFRGRDVVLTMNSVKILHAVRSAITAIAELVVNCCLNISRDGEEVMSKGKSFHIRRFGSSCVMDYSFTKRSQKLFHNLFSNSADRRTYQPKQQQSPYEK